MAISQEKLKEKYARNSAASAQDLVDNYIAATGKLDKAKSPAAQAAYEAAMRDPEVLARRLKNLGKVQESDMNAAMAAKGASAYSQGTAAAAEKQARNMAPYLDVQDKVKAALPPRSRDGMANVDNRLKPFVKAAMETKKRLG